jgi:vacuolar-type H+-ATPase subunit F/Vma7
MPVIVFIGDELSAAGYRLCGIDTCIADSSDVLSIVEQACEHASLVLVGSSTTQYLDHAELDTLMEKITPPVLIVPAVNGKHPVPDITSMIHRQLGMLE